MALPKTGLTSFGAFSDLFQYTYADVIIKLLDTVDDVEKWIDSIRMVVTLSTTSTRRLKEAEVALLTVDPALLHQSSRFIIHHLTMRHPSDCSPTWTLWRSPDLS